MQGGRKGGQMRSPKEWGIDESYRDALGRWHTIAPSTLQTILTSMGVDPSRPQPPARPCVRVIRCGETPSLRRSAEVQLEDGTVLRVGRKMPPDIPPGYHWLNESGEEGPVQLIVSPGKCFFPSGLRTWGFTLQLYSLRSKASWGMGDFSDLRRIALWSADELKAGVLFLNPLDAINIGEPQTPSPYFPGSRRFLNLLYLGIEEVPGASEFHSHLARIRRRGRALNRESLIDRGEIYHVKMEALEFLWRRFRGDTGFDAYCAEEGAALRTFGIFSALAEKYGPSWTRWPNPYRRPDSPAVKRFGLDCENRVRFHQWIQWLLHQQLARAAARGPMLIRDLPIGFDPEGADAWIWQDLLASKVVVGAPPDEFNTLGQNWGLPPFIPHKLKEAAYDPIRQTIRAALRHSRGLRIDHVMGLFRLFWIPARMDPSEGAYIRYPAEDLLAIIALESHRARAIIVGEDLGTVEHGVRERLRQNQVLSTRVVLLEKKPPARFPRLALAAVTTHDLPTIAGLWSGKDLQEQIRINMHPNESGTNEMRDRLASAARLPASGPVTEAILRTHRLLGKAPCALVAATLEDMLTVEKRPNMPNTTTERPNWSIPLPLSLEEIEKTEMVRQVAHVLRSGRQNPARGRPAAKR